MACCGKDNTSSGSTRRGKFLTLFGTCWFLSKYSVLYIYLIPLNVRRACLSEAKASHAPKMWTEVSSSVPHFVLMGLLLNPITYKCLLKLLRAVRRPITTLHCVLIKDSNRVFVARLGAEINSRAYLCVLQGPRHNTKCCLPIQGFIFLLMFCLETPTECSGPANV